MKISSLTIPVIIQTNFIYQKLNRTYHNPISFFLTFLSTFAIIPSKPLKYLNLNRINNGSSEK